MSLSINKIQQFRQPPLQYFAQNDSQSNYAPGSQLLGGIFEDTRHVWHAKGASLEVRDTKTGSKVGAWVFGCILKDSNTKIVCVAEIPRPHGRLSLLAVGLECTISGGVICFFDVFSSKVVRAIQINEKISALHIIDPGIEDLNLPGPLRNFDGILSIGTQGGHVFLIDICRQICEESLHSPSKRDELNPCQLVLLTSKNIAKIEQYKEQSVRDSNHLAIHLNAVLDSNTEHFSLKGPKGDDRIHVNREEALTSGLYYCPQLTSLLVGYNFGAFQLWNLTTLQLVYTSPVCDEHLPVNRFALQEPADDPRAFCYIWVSYSNTEQYRSGLPFAVMYSVCYESKEYHEGYGYLYQDFQYCALRFQVELGPVDQQRHSGAPKGGYCHGLQPVTKLTANKEPNSPSISGDTLALCLITWSVWHSLTETYTCTLLFDLNQWYKEQMPSFSKWKDCTNYLLRLSPTDIQSAGNKPAPVLDLSIGKETLRQFVGVQRLEEHFYPAAMSFDLWVLRETDIVLVHNEGVQHLLLSQIEATGPICLIKPNNIVRQIVTLGLLPLFVEETSSTALDVQREIILNVGLEHQLLGWLCKCATEWANGSFASAGCSLEFLVHWAFQRAVTLKSNCDRYCSPLFDYSQVQLDGNTANLLNSCIRQINNLSSLYSYVLTKLGHFLVSPEIVEEQHRSLQMVSVYFEVLQWLVNIGLLPECPPSTYPRPDNPDRISAPYPVQDLIKFYDEKRSQLRESSSDTISDEESLLFIDNLIERKCGGLRLQKQWQEDGGSGLYPPPSLQSLIRAYLIDGAGISHKHSLVIYLFLDLAMALNQNKYSPVITYLIKFPAVFKVSTSSIKITQAFWQLDHGDFTTALEHLLDPFVLGEDLQDWHHSVIMRSLCVQKQYNFALLYLQTVRPPMIREKDVLTGISLFVANKMLDEAFYFMKQHHNNNEDKLLAHLFNECGKNDTLHDLLYKNLNTAEEKSFFGFLKGSPHPASDELQVSYYLLRSRFLEAFDFHAGMKRGKPDRQGLIGQSNLSRTDQVVRIFKSLLPDVSRKLMDYVRKEKHNLWKKVPKPTPFSVFVHNTDEQIKYKSTLIHAALAKAKQTDRINLSERPSEMTEDTPFLRTPRACKTIERCVTPVINPKVVDMGEEDGPTPSKKLKLSPTFSPRNKLNDSINSMMLTPIVKRKTSVQKSDLFDVHTPQSILKGKSLSRHTESLVTEEDDGYDDASIVRSNTVSPKKIGVGLQPRRSLSRTPRPHVQFDIATRVSSSFSDQSSKIAEITSLEDQILQGSLSSRDISLMVSTKDDTNSTEEAFYSPDTSMSEVAPQKKGDEMQQIIEDKGNALYQVNEESVIQSPRARKSYKRSYKELSPVRSSPRLAKQSDQVSLNWSKDQSSFAEPSAIEKPSSMNDESKHLSAIDIPSSMNDEPKQSPRLLQKVKGRKSLSRQVLENNAFSKIPTPVRASSEISFTKTEKTVVVEESPSCSKTITVESRLDISDVSNHDPESPVSQKKLNVKSNVSRKSVLQSDVSFDSDTSIGSDIFLQDRSKIYIPEIPEWLNEYAPLQSKENTVEQPSLKEEIKPPHEIEKSNVEIKQQSEHEYLHTEDSVILQKHDRVVNEENEQKYTRSFDEDKSREVISMEIYDDLSCGSESSNPEDENEVRSGFDELELNVFEPSSPNQIENSYSNVPNSEMAFIEEPPEKQDDAIVISSSEEESGQSYVSSHNEDINVSFERNIQEEDYSSEQYSENEERHEKTDNDIRKDLACSSSSTEKWGFAEQEDIEENREDDGSVGEEPTWAVGQLIFEQGEDQKVVSELVNGAEDDGSSSSSTEKWNFSDQEEIDCSTEREPAEEVEPQPGITDEVVAPLITEEINEKPDENPEFENSAEKELLRTVEQHQSTITDEYGTAKHVFQIGDNTAAPITTEEVTERNKETQSTSLLDATEDETPNESKANQIVEEEDKRMQIDSEKTNSAFEEAPSTSSLVPSKDQSLKVGGAKGVPEMGDLKQVDSSESNKAGVKICSAIPLVATNDQSLENPESKEGAIENELVVNAETQIKILQVIIFNNLVDIDENHESVPKEQLVDTTAAVNETSKIEKVNNSKKDQSTNTTINDTDCGSVPEQKVLRSSKDSSSDTTLEGDAGAQQIVVTAQVHTPSQHRTEQPLIRRVTRRSSLLLSQNADGDMTPSIFDETKRDINMDVSSSDDVFATADSVTPVRATNRARKSSQSSGIIDCQSSTSKETVVEPTVAALLRRTRSASFDDVKTYSRKRSLQRSNSVDEPPVEKAVKPPRGKGKARSVSHIMPAISEERSSKDGRGDRSHLARTYASSRRLTRSQASMVKGIEKSIDLEDGNDSDATIQLDYIDPIGLLDKESYQGEQDPEEKKIYEGSSPSDSTVSSFTRPARTKSRSVSVASDISLPVSPTKSITPEKKHTRKYGSGVKTRLRKQSETSSVVSEKSESAVPSKKSRKKAEVADVEISKPRITRSRGNSVSSAKSGSSNSPKKTTRSKKVISTKPDLPEILEEKSTDVKVGTSQKKQLRKRKSP